MRNLIQCQGNQISFFGNEYDDISTSQDIPEALNNFSFSLKFKNKSVDVKVGVGFRTNSREPGITWWSHGQLDDGSIQLAELESFKIEDFIECHLHKIYVGNKSFRYIKFFKNKNLCGSRIVD